MRRRKLFSTELTNFLEFRVLDCNSHLRAIIAQVWRNAFDALAALDRFDGFDGMAALDRLGSIKKSEG